MECVAPPPQPPSDIKCQATLTSSTGQSDGLLTTTFSGEGQKVEINAVLLDHSGSINMLPKGASSCILAGKHFSKNTPGKVIIAPFSNGHQLMINDNEIGSDERNEFARLVEETITRKLQTEAFGTNLSDAMIGVTEYIRDNTPENTFSRMTIVTDGQANQGRFSPSSSSTWHHQLIQHLQGILGNRTVEYFFIALTKDSPTELQDFGESIYCKEPEDVLGPIEVLSKKKGPLIKKGELLFKIKSNDDPGRGGGAVTPCAYFLDTSLPTYEILKSADILGIQIGGQRFPLRAEQIASAKGVIQSKNPKDGFQFCQNGHLWYTECQTGLKRPIIILSTEKESMMISDTTIYDGQTLTFVVCGLTPEMNISGNVHFKSALNGQIQESAITVTECISEKKNEFVSECQGRIMDYVIGGQNLTSTRMIQVLLSFLATMPMPHAPITVSLLKQMEDLLQSQDDQSRMHMQSQLTSMRRTQTDHHSGSGR